jgi:hypothetical protein
MSELSIISHDYALNAEFARKFNYAVLTLKRRYLLARAGNAESDDKVKQARSDLKSLLDSLVAALEDEAGKAWTAEQAQVPADVLERFRKRVGAELQETIADLRGIIDDLVKGAGLRETAFRVLDMVCEAADATASAAFRRLRRI